MVRLDSFLSGYSQPKRHAPRWLCAALLLVGTAALHAQDSNNVLGLPAVPQVPQPPAAAGASGPAAKPAAASAVSDAQIKSALSGNMSLASFYQPDLVTVRVTTAKAYLGEVPRVQALQAARLVQRDIRLSCGKLCKPGPMPAPTLQANNTLIFDLVLSGYAGKISTADMVNLISAKPIAPGSQPVAAPIAVAVATGPITASVTSLPAGASPQTAPSSEAPASR